MPLKSGNSSKSAIGTYQYQPGISYWPENAWAQSEQIKQDVEINMGSIYTKDASGYIIKPVGVSGVAQLLRGVFQATRSWTNTNFPPGLKAASDDTADGQRKDSFWALNTFIVIKGAADIVPGQLVDLVSAGTATTNDKVEPNTTGVPNVGTVGICQDIFKLTANSQDSGTSFDDRTRPLKTADNDIICVRMGGA